MKPVRKLTNGELALYLTGKKNKRSYTITALQDEAARRFALYVLQHYLPQSDTAADV